MSRVSLADVAIAAVIAGAVLIISPGLAITGILVLIVIALAGITALIARRR